MSLPDRYESRFKYSYRQEAGGQVSAQSTEMTAKDIQDFVNASLGLITESCDQCVHSRGSVCEKLGRPLKERDSMCPSFNRRSLADLR